MNNNVLKLLKQRYFHEGETSWLQLVNRVVNYVCDDESEQFQKDVTQQLMDRIWLPNSPTLVNSGKKKPTGLMACFVVGPGKDTLEDHVETLGDIAAVGKAGGGCGFSGTNIRAEGSPVAGSAHGYAYGPNNYALRVNDYLDMITQGGFRRMALMYALSSDHPNLDEFIALKQTGDESRAARFNQSIMATDKWLFDAINKPESNANRQFNALVEAAWNNGEPGLLFYDTINTNTPYEEEIYATNPCGEQPLPPYGVCNLGSINLNHPSFYTNNAKDGGFSYKHLDHIVETMVQFLDNVGTKNVFPNEKFKTWYKQNRPIGIGIMGFADALLRQGIPYGSQESLDFAESIYSFIYSRADHYSVQLGKKRGIPEKCTDLGRRNITLLSIAPTGSIAFIAECSHGIEPIFSPEYTRTDERGEVYTISHDKADKPFFRSVINSDKTKIPTWKEHVDVQAAFQKHCDSGVSKTVNLTNDTSKETIRDIFIYAWKSGLKGITVYRDGSRQLQVLQDNNSKENHQSKRDAPKRPKDLPCKIFNTSIHGSNWVVLVGMYNDAPFELFAFERSRINYTDGVLIKHGNGKYNLKINGKVYLEDIVATNNTTEEQAWTRLISLSLRHGIRLRFITEQLEKSPGTIVDFSKAVNRVLRKFNTEKDATTLLCTECGTKMEMTEGCATCPNCGYSKCA